jgi:pimeloyl-ACP methyl ester carboxylesterase
MLSKFKASHNRVENVGDRPMKRRAHVWVALTLCLLAVTESHTQTFKKNVPEPQVPHILGKLTTAKKTLSVFGQLITYYEAGRGRTLVLLAQLGWDSHMWSQNMPALAQNYHVIAIDLIGTGESAKPQIDYKMDTWTDFIAEFLRLKGIRKATMVGSVMGGALAVQFALDHPEMSEGFVCAASNSGPGQHQGGKQPANWPSLAGIRRTLMASFYDKSLVTDEVVRQRFEYRLRIDDGYTIQRHLSDHRAPYSVQELSTIKVPALFVWCRQDEITPLKWGEDYAAAVAGAQLVVIDGCGHYPNIEKPGEFNRAVLSFLKNQKP